MVTPLCDYRNPFIPEQARNDQTVLVPVIRNYSPYVIDCINQTDDKNTAKETTILFEINADDLSIHSDDPEFLFHQQNGSELLEPAVDSISRRATAAPPTRNPISESRGKSKKAVQINANDHSIRSDAGTFLFHQQIGSAHLELVLDSITRRTTAAPRARNPISESRGKSKKVFRNCS
ncbi:hypothetical protein CDAR_590901 [Caerostris darwini]|uniref:Uncharacterized protein n=1 Tax=Caerostris darwini TaxID=1538125 RepID=A0AAV4SGG7_9ARAC|nr:hypothetical protein CDAR_590901 [Caerostris darwini]